MVILVAFIGVTTMYSQEKAVSPKYALSFGMAGNFTLDKFNGSIAVKKIIDDEHQLRLFLLPSLFSTDDQSNEEWSNDKKSRQYLSFSLGVGVDYLWTLLKDDNINMFGGTGFSFSHGYYRDKTISQNSSGIESIQESRNPSISCGIRGVLGVEWMVSKKIGIHSEYLLTGLYSWQKSMYTSNILNNHDRTTIGNKISLSSGVLFGVSIYL